MKRRGFTLIELVMVLLLAGLLAGGFILAVVPVTQALLLVREHDGSVQKAQHMFARLSRELVLATNVVSGTSQILVYDFIDPAGIVRRRTLQGGQGALVTLDGVALFDDAASFSLGYRSAPGAPVQGAWSTSSRLVEIVLQSQAVSGTVFTNRVYMRNVR